MVVINDETDTCFFDFEEAALSFHIQYAAIFKIYVLMHFEYNCFVF